MKTIPLTQGKHAIVDDDVFEIISGYRWNAHKAQTLPGSFYAQRSITVHNQPGKRTTDCLHWYVIGKPFKGLVVDHINGDTLDNRRENLRIVTRRGNALNKRVHRDGLPVGARFMRGKNRWVTSIRINGRRKYLGCFKTASEASDCYKQALSGITEMENKRRG